MKRVLFNLLLVLAIGTVLYMPSVAAERQKASVIVAFINNAKTTYDEELSQQVWNTLHKKVDGIYQVIPQDPFLERLNKTGVSDIIQAEKDLLTDAAKDDDADYLVLAQLEPFIRKEKVTVFTYGKDMTATLMLKIIDVRNNKYLYNGKFIEKASDSTTDGLIGNKSVAIMSVNTVLIQAGEVISFRLPLNPPIVKNPI